MSAIARHAAAEIRDEWLARVLCTEPADRPAAEAAISELYRLIGLDPPRFHWVPSPVTAVMTVPPGHRPRRDEPPDRPSAWPLPLAFHRLAVELFGRVGMRIDIPESSVESYLRWDIVEPVRRTRTATLLTALRAADDPTGFGGRFWRDTQCVSWVARFDALRRLTSTAATPELDRRLAPWTTLARSCGPWWPRRDVCVVSERPAEIRTEPAGDHGEVRLHGADGPAVRYRDGWTVHAWHGTRVPSWVIDDPDVRRIENERNVEVRRCGMERIGWPAHIDAVGMTLLGVAPDPGNPGHELRLYDTGRDACVLLAVNGSPERDGTRRRYGLTVPRRLTDPVAAAGWTYGLSADQYAALARRT
ncbi:DUF6745 domain-containing protein [Actinomadura sp. CNU-125]|uniref:DUF6745 domain-containing protein n=1 Tax=Actinomadura sp. CNU-125 TaxID=1904961 RepID=UPI0021CC8713|nr:hypothetical protein [Actinomadura sp. CNU-125]